MQDRNLSLSLLLFMLLWSLCSAYLSCGNCTSGRSLICPNYEEKQFQVELMKDIRTDTVALIIECSNIPVIDLELLNNCNFSEVNYVKFSYCPFTNYSFEDSFAQIGVNPLNLKHVKIYYPLNGSFNLEGYHLRGLFNLKALDLESTELKNISEEAFQQTPKLQILYLRGNHFDTLPKNLFQPLQNLNKLVLTHNSFTSLPDGLFNNLPNLEALYLWYNNLTLLPTNIFNGLNSLMNVSFQSNMLFSLEETLFAQNSNLFSINFKRNHLTTIPEKLFINCSKIYLVNLYDNRLHDIPENLFSSQPALTEVNLGKNKLKALPENLFKNSLALKTLTLSKNLFKTLQPKLFYSLKELTTLYLNENLIESLPSNLFASSINLEKLDLSSNSLINLENDLLSNCRNLKELNLQNNILGSISSNAFISSESSSLKIINLSNNNLTAEGIFTGYVFALNQQLQLEKIDFSQNHFNNFPHWSTLSIFTNLKYFSLAGNFLRDVFLSELVNFTNDIEVVDLRNNRIETIRGKYYADGSKTINVYLGGNNFTCNCTTYEFVKKIQSEDLSRQKYQVSNLNRERRSKDNLNNTKGGLYIQDKESLICMRPTSLRGEKLISIDPLDLTCVMPETMCSSDCPCTLRPFDSMIILECAGENRTKPPAFEVHPGYSYTLDLSNNRMTYFNFSDKMYGSVVNLTLKNNFLIAEGLTKASLLPPHIKFLDLSGNNLTYLDKSFIEKVNDTGTAVALHDNPWGCDCDIKYLHNFIQVNFKKVRK